jgi:hypothetical protein
MEKIPCKKTIPEWPECFIVVPQNEKEKEELKESFEKAGVKNSLAFNKSGINGCLIFPEDLEWEKNGAVKATIEVQGEKPWIDAWFWLVECNDGTERRFAWWNTNPNFEQSSVWTTDILES